MPHGFCGVPGFCTPVHRTFAKIRIPPWYLLFCFNAKESGSALLLFQYSGVNRARSERCEKADFTVQFYRRCVLYACEHKLDCMNERLNLYTPYIVDEHF